MKFQPFKRNLNILHYICSWNLDKGTESTIDELTSDQYSVDTYQKQDNENFERQIETNKNDFKITEHMPTPERILLKNVPMRHYQLFNWLNFLNSIFLYLLRF
jgi:hypothetical protein